jgi:SAM-dependent methyltransferase
MTLHVDPTGSQTFADRMREVANDGALALMVSVGHRTGLFDAMASMPASTSEEIAERAGLFERYVRAWLGAMATGRIVEYDPATRRFRLPPEHAASLARTPAWPCAATTMQFIPLLGAMEDRVVASFRDGRGVPCSAFPRFQQVIADESLQTTVSALLDRILPLVPGLTKRLEEGISVLDIGCGSGRALHLLARTFPKSRFVGYDLSHDGIASARASAARDGCANARFEVRDVANLRETETYELVTAFGVVSDLARPEAALRAVRAALVDGGVLLLQDVGVSVALERNLDHPLGPLLHTISCMHCMTVAPAEEESRPRPPWGVERARSLLEETGFREIATRALPHDVRNAYFTARR